MTLTEPITNLNNYFLWASWAAERSEHGIYRMGAVIVKSGRRVAIGWNKNKTHPRARNYTQKIHAELDALIGYRFGSLNGADMYVIRITNGGAIATSKPCKDCMALIKEAGLASVTFISEEGRICTTNL